VDPYADVQDQYAAFARHCHGESPCFEEWSQGVVDDPEVVAWIAALPGLKKQPNLVFAAARWHGVPAPGPYAALRRALLDDDGTIRATVLARSTQTNEVGRLATLVPAFAQAAGDRPVALIEVGASAGLNLFPDRWGLAWSVPGGLVELGPEPRLPCAVTGPAPLPRSLPEVAWRAGIDLNPLDVTDPDATAWLENLVWPEQDERRERLRHAVAVARTDPPRLVRGDLLDALPALVEEAAEHGPVVVFHTAVIAYLDDAERERFWSLMTGLVDSGACHWVSNEGVRVLPRLAPAEPGSRELFVLVLALDGRPVARTHGHGRTLHWLGD
jgi:hypothetical protein